MVVSWTVLTRSFSRRPRRTCCSCCWCRHRERAPPAPGCELQRTWDTGVVMTTLPLIQISSVAPAGGVALARGTAEPAAAARHRAKLPPRHLADLDLAGRRAAVTELGEPGFRAAQLSTHYFDRLERDPARMTDIPAATRDRLTEAMMPRLLTPVR